MKTKLSNLIFPLLLAAVGLILAFTNYTPGTVLSGWDTLHPEFNLGLYLQRIFWGVWQQHQGLGAVAAQAHASELGRLWYLWIPFRYGYFWLTLIIGPLGVYKLLGGKIKGFLGGLFYLLNLGTLQHFYLPLEMFATAYAFLPWLFWAAVSKKIWPLILFFILSAPMAHTPTLWAVNFFALVIFALVYDRRWGVKVAIIGLLVNSFWLLPSSYYVLTRGGDVANSHISQQFSFRAMATSKEFGNLWDIALIRGYLFDWGHFDFVSRQFADLFPVWKNHLANPLVLAIGYGSFGAVLLGVLISLKKKMALGVAMIPVLLVSVLGLMAFIDTEALRFPFTKFSFLLILGFAVYFGVAVACLKRFWIIVAVLLIFYMWPAFNGNLICKCERVTFPPEYQQTFDWFDAQDHNSRIAPFPIDSIYGWGYYGWGYEGAGFRWFGLPQPILDREFDRWMPQNENYYWEISQAVYAKNLPLFESVLEKYRTNWLLVDENIIEPTSPKALYLDELKDLIKESEQIKLIRQIGQIGIYEFSLRVFTRSFVSVASGLPGINGYKWGNLDQAYFDLGDYSSGQDYIYPYRTLFTGRSQADLEFDPEKLVSGNPIITSAGAYPGLSHRDGYLIKITAKNIGGKPFLFWIEDLNSRRAVLESYLPVSSIQSTSYYVLPPMEPDGLGYSFHLDSNTIGKEVSKNELEKFEVYKIDFWEMVMRKEMLDPAGMTSYTPDFTVAHPNPAFYRIDTDITKSVTLILAQSFDAGWVAIGAKNHVLINDWANGWEVEPGARTIYLFYWPQLLEFAGFGLLGLLAVCLLTPTKSGLTRPVVWDRIGKSGYGSWARLRRRRIDGSGGALGVGQALGAPFEP